MMVWLIIIPIAAGLLVLLAPSRVKGLREGISLIGAAAAFILSIALFVVGPPPWSRAGVTFLRMDTLSGFILVATGLFGVLIVLYSLRFMAGKDRRHEYYACLMITLGSAFGVLLAAHLLLLAIFWGVLGITLYLLVGLSGPPAADAAKKTFVIVGGSDAFLLLGVILLWNLTGNWQLGETALPLRGVLTVLAFLSLLIAALAKVGAMPLHSWLPDASERAPVPVAAFLPASLDKLVGIYLLARICLNLFQLGAGAHLILMVIGAVTIVAAVMMALIQHDAKRLLGFHAVSQAGYMILGIGTGTAIGVAGGLFHMLNNAIYKQGLFLATGAVEAREGTTDLERLGGLARSMPVTFGAFLVLSLAISGIPPLNGFISKWMIYQGLIEMGGSGGGWGARLWVVWLLAAMFGSALTLASFMKLLHAIFLGLGRSGETPTVVKKEVGWSMWLPPAVLSFLCIIFGVFAFRIIIRGVLAGAVPGLDSAGVWIGWWRPDLATGLIVLGLVLGWLIYLAGNLKGLREDTPYIGGEAALPPESRVTGTEFYNTIKEVGVLKIAYRNARLGRFDIYAQGKICTFWLADRLRALHSGLLPVYLSWCLLGIVILLVILMR